jgi:hypothetical protein
MVHSARTQFCWGFLDSCSCAELAGADDHEQCHDAVEYFYHFDLDSIADIVQL